MEGAIISQQYIKEILSEVGYPVIKMEDLEISEQDFKDIVIIPAMRDYFVWFPKQNIQEYELTAAFEVDFPNEKTFTVIQSYLNTAGFGVRSTTNPFLNNSVYRAVNNASSYGGGLYGTKWDYDMRQARTYDRMERQSLIDTNKAFRVDVHDDTRKITGFSNITGKLVVVWAEWSDDFNDVPFRRIPEVIKMAKVYLLRNLGMLRSQQISTLPNQFNYEAMIKRADDLEEQTMKVWKGRTKTIIMKG